MLLCLTESVRSYYNLIIKKAGQFLTDLQLNLLKFALASRSYSPAVHASQQVWCEQNSVKWTIVMLSHWQPGHMESQVHFLLEVLTFAVSLIISCSFIRYLCKMDALKWAVSSDLLAEKSVDAMDLCCFMWSNLGHYIVHTFTHSMAVHMVFPVVIVDTAIVCLP